MVIPLHRFSLDFCGYQGSTHLTLTSFLPLRSDLFATFLRPLAPILEQLRRRVSKRAGIWGSVTLSTVVFNSGGGPFHNASFFQKQVEAMKRSDHLAEADGADAMFNPFLAEMALDQGEPESWHRRLCAGILDLLEGSRFLSQARRMRGLDAIGALVWCGFCLHATVAFLRSHSNFSVRSAGRFVVLKAQQVVRAVSSVCRS